MDLPSAISEFAEMLALGSNALHKLVERQKRSGDPAAVEAIWDEAQDIAHRLSAIAEELRRRAVL